MSDFDSIPRYLHAIPYLSVYKQGVIHSVGCYHSTDRKALSLFLNDSEFYYSCSHVEYKDKKVEILPVYFSRDAENTKAIGL